MEANHARARWERLSGNPELNLFFVSFLVHFVWEMWQLPYYEGIAGISHVEAVRGCTQASLGDGLISVIAFWAAAALTGTRHWYLNLRPGAFLTYLAVGVAITILMEWLATGALERWHYDAAMPRLPLLGTGLLPVLQWLLLPPLTLALMRRQTRSAHRPTAPSVPDGIIDTRPSRTGGIDL